MKIVTSIVVALALTGCGLAQIPTASETHTWTATLKIVDESGQPVEGAKVRVSYMLPPPPGTSTWGKYGAYGDNIDGLTDTNGIFVATHKDSTPSLGFHIEKTGYYKTFKGHEMGYSQQYTVKKWNPNLTLTLKKTGQPIAMYAKSFQDKLPLLNAPVGYDLMAGDWVAPHGKGVNADVVLKKEYAEKSSREYYSTITVSFPKVGDGIQVFAEPDAEKGSSLRSPYKSPLDGYQPELTRKIKAQPGQPNVYEHDPKRIYFFRVRTVLDENGNIKSTHYGKIYGDFMRFKYYLNPTPNDRNVEFDPKQNLLKNLKDMEQVREP